MRPFIISAIMSLCAVGAIAQQTPRQLPATRTTATFKIDGDLSEAAWKDAIPATNLVEWRPNSGKQEDTANRTIVYILYDNTSIYIGGYCYERTKDSISHELVGRDKVGVNDFVGVMFDTYNDKINAVGFYVTPYGEQFDAKYSNSNGEDASWNSVWASAGKIHNDGWSFEMRIPYSCLRFVSKENQTWGLNITRRRNKTGQQFMWNPVDPQKNGFINQEGEWTGITKIDPPLRLSFSPYLSAYANHYPYNTPGIKNWSTSVNGGMDVKWGISQSFTLDMTLIPDFGQVQSDNRILNLTPFEQQYQENRPFFTEGTELFSKGNLFYSRRIGSTPIHYGDVDTWKTSDEHVLENPVAAKLVNATKLSGRTKNGLGIGILNAITQPMYAVLETNDGKDRRKVQTSPLTNYNVMVFDQTLKNNSSVSFINTNVLRDGPDYDANVSSFLFDVNNKKNTYNWNGNLSLSTLTQPNAKSIVGHAHNLSFGKTGGRFNFNLTQEIYDDKYNKRDLGFMNNNNYLDHYLWLGYKWTKPEKWFNNLYLNFNAGYSRRYKPSAYQQFFTNVNVNGMLKNLWNFFAYVGYNADGYDYYESRDYQNHYPFLTKHKLMTNINISTNNAKKYKASISTGVDFNSRFTGHRFDFTVYQRYRFSDKLSIDHQIFYNPWIDDAGFYDYYTTNGQYDVLFSRRNRNTIENITNIKYSLSNRAFINFRVRHYWSDVEVKELYDLQSNGDILPTRHSGIPIKHENFNLFNIDAGYTLEFAPGSFINLVWKNEASQFADDYHSRYFSNFSNTLDSPQNNNFSVKIIYYLDYLSIKKKKH